GEDQHNWDQQGQEGQERARQLFRSQQLCKVLSDQVFMLLIFLVNAVKDLELRLGILGAVDLIRNNKVRVLLAEVAEQRDHKDEQRDRDRHAADDEHAEVNAQAVFLEGADNSQRAGGRRHHEVRDVQ